ncbi:N-acetylneuraminate synthase [Vibrio neptunius]|uniref:N-acetylneuraminate synthase family protein n=1 Tax=Vibrio neptunius TaxID=170651 RepID=UPI0005FA4854|nr:N-acetylneuraminate synthase family protein [Vibrio neptunius]KJY86185.1 N-acetylneuraminate synthase [Vibrio neptunius]
MVSGEGCYVIAEIGQAHEGSLGILHSYIDAVASTGADAIKFQTHIAEAESSIHEPFRVKFSYEDASRYDYWQRMSFSETQWHGIAKHCKEVGLDFISSPFSIAAVELLERVGVEKYKIGSGEVSNLLLLEKVAKTGKPVIISSGMSSLDELDLAVNHLRKYTNDISILQCTSSYPVPPEKLGLNVISELKSIYDYPIGLSDHSSTIYPSIAAVALGAEIIEAHIVFDKSMFGPDSKSSLDVNEFKSMVEGVNYLNLAMQNPVDKSTSKDFLEMKKIFEKSLAVNKSLKAGTVITLDDLESKKPANMGICAGQYKSILGKKLNKDLSQWEFITGSDIDE